MAVAGTRSAGKGVSKAVNGLVNRHVSFFEHGLDALEVRSASEISAIDDRADVSPLGIHRTGRVDDEGQFDLSTAGVVPSDLDVVVGINDHIGVSLVADDGREEGVVKERDNGA